jgi:hypothetical protein
MKMLLATALLIAFSAFTAAHAEWETLDAGTAVYAGAKTASTAVAQSAAPSNACSSGPAAKHAEANTKSK